MPDPLDAAGCQAPRAVIVGDFWRDEFSAILEAAADLFRPQHLQACGDVESLLADTGGLEKSRPIDLLVVLQHWPEQYTQRQVSDLLDRYPLARLVVCGGPWCDSDGRTRDIWPLAVRVCHWQAAARLRREWDVIIGQAGPLPLTASRDESFGFDHAETSRRILPVLSIEVRTPDPAVRDMIAELLRLGNGLVCETPQAQPELVIWDTDPWSADLAEEIVTCHRQQSDVPIIALAGFPRVHESTQMRQCGVDAVLTKTAPADQYLSVITSLCGELAHRPSRASARAAALPS